MYMKHLRLSAIFAAASLLVVSTAGLAAHKSSENFKGENFKAEVPPPCPPILVLHDGFYIGAGLGYDSARVHESVNTWEYDAPDFVVPSFTESASRNQSLTGWMGGLFVGYGHYFDWFYLGAELNGNISDADSTASWSDSDGNWVSSKVEMRGTYGISILPGIKVNDSSLLYARLGYLRTNFKAKNSFNFVSDPDDSPVTAAVSGSSSNNKWRNGFTYGVGIETYVAEYVSVRGEFDHTTYNSRSVTASVDVPNLATPPVVVGNITSTAKFKPSNNEFMLSLLYHFC